MEKLLEDLKSTNWWLGVVVMTIVLNVGSSYLRISIDRLLAKFSEKRRLRNERQAAERAAMIKLLVDSPLRRESFRFSVLSGEISVCVTWVIAFGNVLLGTRYPFMMALGALAIIYSIRNQSFWRNQAEILSDAYRQLYEQARETSSA